MRAVEELIQQYAGQLRNERNISPHTLRNYLSDLSQFCQFLLEKALCLRTDGSVDVSKIDVYVMRAYLASLMKSRKKSSVGRKIAAL
jgi:integrase/recombinase XerC